MTTKILERPEIKQAQDRKHFGNLIQHQEEMNYLKHCTAKPSKKNFNIMILELSFSH